MLGKKAFDSFQWCPVLFHPSLDTWQKLPKHPNRNSQSLAPGEGVSCWLQKEFYLPCARIMTKFYPRNTQLVWLDPQTYLLGKTVRFKEHTIPIRFWFFFFNGLCLVDQMKPMWLSPAGCVSYPGSHSSVSTYQQLRNQAVLPPPGTTGWGQKYNSSTLKTSQFYPLWGSNCYWRSHFSMPFCFKYNLDAFKDLYYCWGLEVL